MAEFPSIEAPEADIFEFGDLFDAGQLDNIVIGINRGVDGFEQAIAEGKEFLGLEPAGHAEFVTQELKKDQKFLREANVDDQLLSGAAGFEFVGEALPLVVAPFGATVPRAIGFGAASGAGFFQEDVTDSRLDDILLAGAGGGVLRALLRGGPNFNRLKNELDTIPAGQRLQPVGPRQLVPTTQPRAARAAEPGGLPGQTVGAQRLLEAPPVARTLADDVFRTGDSVAPPGSALTTRQIRAPGRVQAIEGIARVRRGLAQATKATRKEALAAARKAQRFSRNQARKVEALRTSRAAAARAGQEKAVEKFDKQITEAQKDKIAANTLSKAIIANEARKISPPPRAAGPAPRTPEELTGGPIPEAEVFGARPRPTPRGPAGAINRQGGFAESDLINTLGGAAAFGLGGLAASGGDPVVGVASAISGGALVRALGRRADKIVTNKMREQMRRADAEGGDFNADLSRFVKARDFTGEAISNAYTGAKKVLNSFAGATITRLEALAPRVAVALKEAEFQQHFQSGQWIGQGEQLFKTIEDAGLTDQQARTYKIALLNSTKNAKAYLRSIGKEDAAVAVEGLETILNDAGQYLQGVGLGNNLRANYFPRMVTDTSAFENIQEVKTYLAMLARQKGIALTDFEKEVAITQVINGALTKRESGKFARAASNLQKRTIKVDRNNVNAYADPHEAFNDYVESITNQVERRRFFERLGVKTDDLGPNAENLDSVAGRLAKSLQKGELSEEEVDEVAKLISLRFGPGEQAPTKAVQNIKNLTYAGLLGNPMSAATQFGDLALSAHRNGIRNTVRAAIGEIAGRGKVNGIDKQELLGIRNAAADFASRTSTRDALDWSLKFGGFQAVDRLGKNTFIQSALLKNQQLDRDAFISKWRPIFDPDAPAGAPAARTEELFQKVRGFRGIDDTNREDIGFMLWNELQEVQPIALSAFPEQYLANPNGRMFFMLQSFTLKLFDVMRRDIIQQAQAGNYRQAAKNATRLSTLFVMNNGSVEAAKNFVTGKEQSVPEVVVNNYLKMLGMNKFMFDSAARDGLGTAALQGVTPFTTPFDITSPEDALELLPPFGRALGPFLDE